MVHTFRNQIFMTNKGLVNTISNFNNFCNVISRYVLKISTGLDGKVVGHSLLCLVYQTYEVGVQGCTVHMFMLIFYVIYMYAKKYDMCRTLVLEYTYNNAKSNVI